MPTARRSAVLHDELRRIVLLEGERSPQLDEFVVRWQQTTGPGDGEGRRGHRLLPLLPAHRAERGRRRSGSLLDRPGRVPRCRARALRAPSAAAARVADARHEARRRCARAHRCARRHARALGRACSPLARADRGMDDPNEEYLVWQTLVGAWPIVPARLELYLEKALREGKRTTNWLDAGRASTRRACGRSSGRSTRTRSSSTTSSRSSLDVALAGEHASLGALLLRLTTPGLPDIYQGDAFWSLNLVDPDNRRPVDWKRALPRRAGDRTAARDDEVPPHPARAPAAGRVSRRRSSAPTSRSTSGPTGSGSSAAGGSASSFRSGPTTRVEAPGDLLPEYPQELSLLR